MILGSIDSIAQLYSRYPLRKSFSSLNTVPFISNLQHSYSLSHSRGIPLHCFTYCHRTDMLEHCRLVIMSFTLNYLLLLDGITFLHPVYSITNLKQYLVFHGIWSSKIAQEKCIGKHLLCTYPIQTVYAEVFAVCIFHG